MSLLITILCVLAAWMAIAIAMLWGLLRVARRHHPEVQGRNAPVTPIRIICQIQPSELIRSRTDNSSVQSDDLSKAKVPY